MRIRFSCFFLLLGSAFSGFAQNIPGSVYSSYGFGDLSERSSSYTRAIGNTSIAVRNDNNVNASNPAALTAITKPVTSFFEIGTYYGSTYSNNTTSSKSNKYGGLSGINYWFRAKSWWGTLLGVSPVSILDYSVTAPHAFATSPAIQITSSGTGGINQFYFGNAFDILKNLSVGVNVSYYLGTIKKVDNVPATNVTGLFQVERQTTANGLNADFGLQYGLNIKKTTITFGAIYDPGAHLSGVQQSALINPITFDTLQKTDKKNVKSKLPPVWGGGISIKRNRSAVAFDLRYLQYTKAVFDQNYSVRDSYKFSGGYDYRGDYNSFNYLKTISLRAGGWVQSYPFLIQGAKLTTWGYTLGVALPIQNNRATVSLNYRFTQNGVSQNDLIREQSRLLTLDVIFRDIWGIKRKFD